MTDKKKTEVNLEMCSGFFRIPTDDIIYNITVLSSNEPSTTKVVEKIIEVEKIVEVEKKTSTPVSVAPGAAEGTVPAPAVDDYYQQAAQKIQQEITLAAGEADAGGGLGLGAITDLADMATELKEVLLGMKKHPLMSGSGVAAGGSNNLAPALQQLVKKIAQAKSLCVAPSAVEPTAPTAVPATKTVTRYLFNLDTVFQTIYELCTNETVKTHIKNARAKVDEIFDKDAFYNAISPKVSNYPEDDGFLNVPMTDIYTALGSACSDKSIANLLVKMDKQQADIFLDQFLLMEIPAKEEVTVAAEESATPAVEDPPPQVVSGVEGLPGILDECQADLDKLIQQGPDQGGGDQTAESDDFANKVDDAINIAASIQNDAKRLAEGAGTNPLWLKIKGLAALAETMLSRKEQESALTYTDGLLAGQAAAQHCLDEITPKAQAAPPSPAPKKETAAKKAPDPENFGEASQDDIDRLLEELG